MALSEQLKYKQVYNLIFENQISGIGIGANAVIITGIIGFDDARKITDVYTEYQTFAVERNIDLHRSTFYKVSLGDGTKTAILHDAVNSATEAYTFPVQLMMYDMDPMKVESVRLLLKQRGYNFELKY